MITTIILCSNTVAVRLGSNKVGSLSHFVLLSYLVSKRLVVISITCVYCLLHSFVLAATVV